MGTLPILEAFTNMDNVALLLWDSPSSLEHHSGVRGDPTPYLLSLGGPPWASKTPLKLLGLPLIELVTHPPTQCPSSHPQWITTNVIQFSLLKPGWEEGWVEKWDVKLVCFFGFVFLTHPGAELVPEIFPEGSKIIWQMRRGEPNPQSLDLMKMSPAVTPLWFSISMKEKGLKNQRYEGRRNKDKL